MKTTGNKWHSLARESGGRNERNGETTHGTQKRNVAIVPTTFGKLYLVEIAMYLSCFFLFFDVDFAALLCCLLLLLLCCCCCCGLLLLCLILLLFAVGFALFLLLFL